MINWFIAELKKVRWWLVIPTVIIVGPIFLYIVWVAMYYKIV